MNRPTKPCIDCGSSNYEWWNDGTGPDTKVTEHTTPSWCDDCREAYTLSRRCSCWLSFDGMTLADIKAVFAADGTFSVGGLGRHEQAGA